MSLNFSPEIISSLDKIIELEKEKLAILITLINGFSLRKYEVNPDFLKPISSLMLTARSDNCFKAEGFHYIGDIICNPSLKARNHYREFYKLCLIPNFGKKSLRELLQVLDGWGINQVIDCPDYMNARIQKYGIPFKNKTFSF